MLHDNTGLKTLAILSPDKNAYSETFIKMHKSLPYNIRYYYNGYLPSELEGRESLLNFSLKEKIEKKIRRQFSHRQYALFYSLKREKVDAVLAEYGVTACQSLAVIKALQLPLVVHFHGYDASMHEIKDHYSADYEKVFEYATTIVAVSGQMKEALVEMKCPGEKIIVSAYGPDPFFFDAAPSYGSQHFVSVGRFVEKKAPQLTIQAFKKVSVKFPDATLTMIGAGELLDDCKNLAISLQLSDKIEFAGIQAPAAIKKIFEQSIAFVQHSVIAANGDSEGTPVAILEAQAAALPVISTRHAGIPEVVLDEKTGLLCTEKNTDAMAENMLRILTEDGLAKRLGENGRKRIKQYFTLEMHLKALEDAIDSSIKTSQ